jgi:hypothetical protein
MSLRKEIAFETEICQHLAVHGWAFTKACGVYLLN